MNFKVGNHDNHRVVDRWGENRGDLYNILVQTLPGIAVTYNGEEIVMHDVYIPYDQTVDPLACNQGPDNFALVSRDPARTPFQWDDTKLGGFTDGDKTWLPVSPDFRKNNVGTEIVDPNSHLSTFIKLVNLRKKPVLQFGDFVSIVQNDMLIYRRKYLNYQVFVVLNFGDGDRTINFAETFFNIPALVRPTITSQWSGLRAGIPIRTNSDITIPADGAAVFE